MKEGSGSKRNFTKDPVVCRVCGSVNRIKTSVERGSHEKLVRIPLYPGGPVIGLPTMWRHSEPNDFGTFSCECLECGFTISESYGNCCDAVCQIGDILSYIEKEFEDRDEFNQQNTCS